MNASADSNSKPGSTISSSALHHHSELRSLTMPPQPSTDSSHPQSLPAAPEQLSPAVLASRIRSVSFDAVTATAGVVRFTFSARDEDSSVLEEFITELHLDLATSSSAPAASDPGQSTSSLATEAPGATAVAAVQPFTAAEKLCLLCLGICHSGYIFLPFSAAINTLQFRAGYMTREQLDFFEHVLKHALAEYYFLADAPLEGALRIECCCEPPPAPQGMLEQAFTEDLPTYAPSHGQGTAGDALPHPPRVLVPFGGGKDSTLLMHLLADMGCKVQWAYYGEWLGSWGNYTKNIPCQARLQELNMRASLHFPDYVAYVSFYVYASAFLALRHGYNYICVGNEHSANFGNAVHPRYGYEVNHQYEKSFAAEVAYNRFIKANISPRLHYFSGLQHMTELEIAARFAATCAQRYLHLIISCNWATSDDWCGGCEKCVFVYIMFAAFLPPEQLIERIFGAPLTSGPLANCTDMFDSPAHLATFEGLMGLRGHKPLECVGTPQEVLAALYLALRNYQRGHLQLPLLLQKHEGLISSQGKSEWESVQAAMQKEPRDVAQNLYPPWYVLSKVPAVVT